MGKVIHKGKSHTMTDMIGKPVGVITVNVCDEMSLSETTSDDSKVTCKKCLKALEKNK